MTRTTRPEPHVRMQTWGLSDQIEIQPGVCGGNPVLKGTHIPVAVLYDAMVYGKTWYFTLDSSLPQTKGD